MTGRRRPPRSPRVGAGRNPRGAEIVPQLSDEEVQRRIETRGGGAGPVPPPLEHTLRDRRPNASARGSGRGTGVQNAILLVALAIVGLVALSIMLPRDPQTASASLAPTATSAAVAPSTLASVAPTGTTAALITLPPATTGPETLAPPTIAPTTAPTAAPPTPTLPPGATPRPTPRVTPSPTPKPTKTPVPTPTRTPTPTQAPAAPKLTVVVNVASNNGGTAARDDWTLTPGQAGASPSVFPGSSGTEVTMVAGAPYLVTVEADTAEAAGYSISRSGSCSGTLIAGQQATCTITMNDIKPSLKVVTHVVGSAPASSWDVSVSGTNVSPTGTQSGSESGVTFRLDAHATFDVSQSGPSGYDTSTSGTCSGSGLLAGEVVTCTFTYTEQPSPTAVALQAPLAPVALLLPALRFRLRGRRWRTTSTGR